MEAKELRIGNYISRSDLASGDLRTEQILELETEKVTTTGPIKVISFYDEIKPIPLTEEWLLKFGFYKVNISWYNELCPFAITNWIRPDNNTSGYSAELNHINLCDLIYIHDLQNLHFALTGEELIFQK
jgi:hypothetical protein